MVFGHRMSVVCVPSTLRRRALASRRQSSLVPVHKYTHGFVVEICHPDPFVLVKVENSFSQGRFFLVGKVRIYCFRKLPLWIGTSWCLAGEVSGLHVPRIVAVVGKIFPPRFFIFVVAVEVIDPFLKIIVQLTLLGEVRVFGLGVSPFCVFTFHEL